MDRLRADNKPVYLEIQGHTDASGNPAYNHPLGVLRADAVVNVRFSTSAITQGAAELYAYGTAVRLRRVDGGQPVPPPPPPPQVG